MTSAKQRKIERTTSLHGHRALRPGVEYEFDQITLPRDLSRGAVTRLLVERAETGGWELDRVRIGIDGRRRIVLRRKIIRQPQPMYWLAG